VSEFTLRTVVLLRQLFRNPALYVSLSDIKALNVPWTLKQSEHRDSSQSLQYLTAIEDFVALEQRSHSCEEEAISFLKLNAIKIDYNSAL
jgi:hypothetical protein